MSIEPGIVGIIASIVAILSLLLHLRSRSKREKPAEEVIKPKVDARLEPPAAMPAPKQLDERIKDHETRTSGEPSDDDVARYLEQLRKRSGK